MYIVQILKSTKSCAGLPKCSISNRICAEIQRRLWCVVVVVGVVVVNVVVVAAVEVGLVS